MNNRTSKIRFRAAVAILALLIAIALWLPARPAQAEGADTDEATQGSTGNGASRESNGVEPEDRGKDKLFQRVRVVAKPVEKIPGSVTYMGKTELQKQSHTDVNRVLRGVPGVNLQEEDGYGLRPNIGMRGTGTERSQKITLLEDGVLIAPAPYSAPSAYYFPSMGRMEGVEVRKGSSSIRQGPQTNGGVLNMISTSIPSDFGGLVDLALGQDETVRGRLSLGNSTPTFGWLFETFQMDTEGFKDLDGGGPTGFELQDYMVKLRVNSGAQAAMFQAVELKLGRTDQFGNETYLGLTDEDFGRTPFRRYAASQQDNITAEHAQAQLSYFARPSNVIDFTATLYRNEFFRNWRKLQSVNGMGLSSVLEDPAAHPYELAVLRGDVDSAADELALRNNRRDYYSHGIQTVVGIAPRGGLSAHDFEFGLRYHEDAEDRFQEEDRFAMTGGRMNLTSVGEPGSQSNRISSASAWALFLQDTISLKRWTITPGLRYESIDFLRRDYGKSDPQRTGAELTLRQNDVDVLIPGIGANYQIDRASTVFFGVHRGFAPPGPGADPSTEPEESINYELGYRRSAGLWNAEAVLFFNDYANLLGNDTLSSGGTGEGDQFNGGEVRVHGLETALQFDLGRANGWSLQVPLALTYTYTHGEFLTTFESEFEGWGDVVFAGDELPYLPHHQATLSAGLVERRWATYFSLSFTGAMRTEAGQGPIVPELSTDAHWLFDVTVNYNVHRNVRLYVQMRNLTDEHYVAARRPAGIRPGMPRNVLAGVSWNF